VLQCVAVCCSVLQCVAVCCSVLQCVAVCCSVLQCVAAKFCGSALQPRFVGIVSGTHSVAVRCRQHTLQHTATHATHCNATYAGPQFVDIVSGIQSVAVRCRQQLQATHTATHCNTLQHNATHCNVTYAGPLFVDIVGGTHSVAVCAMQCCIILM